DKVPALLVEIRDPRMRFRRGWPDTTFEDHAPLGVIPGLRVRLLHHVAIRQWRQLDIVGIDQQDLVNWRKSVRRELQISKVGSKYVNRTLDRQLFAWTNADDILCDNRVVRSTLAERRKEQLNAAAHDA